MRQSVTPSPVSAPRASVVDRGRDRLERWRRSRAWRYRAALAPLYAGSGMLFGSEMAHLVAPGSWWLAVPAGALVTARAVGPPESWHERLSDWALGWVRSEYERRFAGAVGATGTVWLAVDWWHGPNEPLVLALAAGCGAIGTARLWHRRIRHDSETRHLRRAWTEHLAAAAKLPGSMIQSIKPISGGRAIRLRLAPGQTVDDVRRNLDRVISALGLRPRSCRIEADVHHPRRCTILVCEVDVEPEWRHYGRPVGRPRPGAISVVPLDDDAEPGFAEEASLLRVLRPANAQLCIQPAPRVVEVPRPRRLEVPESDPLLEALRATPQGLAYGALATQTGIPTATLTRRLRRLREQGLATSNDGVWSAPT